MKTRSKIIINRNFKKINNNVKIFESKYLNIDSSKVFKALNWSPMLSIEKSVDLTIEWHKKFIKKENLLKITKIQILEYLKKINL